MPNSFDLALVRSGLVKLGCPMGTEIYFPYLLESRMCGFIKLRITVLEWLIGLITRRSQVQFLPPQPNRNRKPYTGIFLAEVTIGYYPMSDHALT